MFQTSQKIREASHAGSWYIGDGKQLDAQLNEFLSKAKGEPIPNIKAIIGPHAGFSYSGPTAAFAYQHLIQKEKMRVFLLGPCHHTYIKGIGLSELDMYETPLGNIELDQPSIYCQLKKKKFLQFYNQNLVYIFQLIPLFIFIKFITNLKVFTINQILNKKVDSMINQKKYTEFSQQIMNNLNIQILSSIQNLYYLTHINKSYLNYFLNNTFVDLLAIKQISAELKKNFVFTNKEIEEQEHSLEMHLPFIYKLFPQCKLIPIMVGATTEQQDAQVANVLVKYFVDPNTVFVISSDFCHWGKRFQYTLYNKEHGEIHQSIAQLDGQAIKLIESHNLKEFYKYLEDTENTICGRHPICVLLNIINLSKLQLKTQLTKYNQSNEVIKSNDSSVSYAALVTSLI